MPEPTCGVCAEPFTARSPNQRYCSVRCRKRHHKAKARAAGKGWATSKTNRTCTICAGRFTSPNPNTRSCPAPVCRWLARTGRASTPLTYSDCPACGVLFISRPGRKIHCKPERAPSGLPPFTCRQCTRRCTPGQDGVHHRATAYCSPQCMRRWHRNTPRSRAQRKVRRANDKALERGSQGAFTLSQWGARLVEYGGCCAYCQDPDAQVEIEHVVPLCRGGTNRIANIVPACRACNQEKGTLTPNEWLASGRPRALCLRGRASLWPQGQALRLLPDPIAA